ncbi:LPS-assembly protein LptD [bacterium]|nr:LPS-assembly protein LptD [bacterium]
MAQMMNKLQHLLSEEGLSTLLKSFLFLAAAPLLFGFMVLFHSPSLAVSATSSSLSSLSPSSSSPSPDEIKVIAHHKEKVEDRIVATGNVEVHYKNIKIFADDIELNTETKDVVAHGHVVIHFPQEVINVDEIRINLENTQGTMTHVEGLIQPTIFYEAQTVKRRDQSVYTLKKAQITSCTQPVPRWKFSCSKANFRKNDYIEMWNSVFSIRKIPLLYVPYIRYPLDREKSTGFLTPQLGFSGVKGLVFSESFYWDIRRNMDATFSFDLYSAKGLGGGLQYRYKFPKGIGGELNAYYFNFLFGQEGIRETQAQEMANAYMLRLNHNQPLPYGFGLTASVDYQSNFDFLRQFDNNFRRAMVTNRRSQVYVQRSWGYYNFSMKASRFETYFRRRDDSVIKYELPRISFNASRIKLFSPLYFSFSSSFLRWQYGWQDEYKNGTQRQSQDLNFQPTLTLPFKKIPWLNLETEFTSPFSYNFQSYAPGTRDVVDESVLSYKYAINSEARGPVFYKIYFSEEGKPFLKHIIEPSVAYRYESPRVNADRLIDYRLRFRDHSIQYSLTNRFLVNRGGMPREIFSLGVSQKYYLSPEDSPMQRYPVDDRIPNFSNVSGDLRFYPSKKYSLDFSAGFNPHYMTFQSLRLGANLGSRGDPAFLNVNWYKSINPYRESAVWNRHQISSSGGLKIPALDLEAFSQVTFNIQEMKMLYAGGSLTYHYQCLDFEASLRMFFFRDTPETQFRITFGLGNIGKTTDFLGGAETL